VITQVLVLNGPNLGRLGTREPEIYGSVSFDDLTELCRSTGRTLGLHVDVRQTDDESELIGWVHEAADARMPVVLNPAAFTHYSYALRDALAMRTAPLVEVHISNPAARESFRHTSVVAAVADGTVAGFGLVSYQLALQAIAALTAKATPAPASPRKPIYPERPWFLPPEAQPRPRGQRDQGGTAAPPGHPATGYSPAMRIGMFLSYAGGFAETVTELADFERAGLDIVFVPEAYSFDAVSQLGYIAARTERLQIASGILQIYSRTPALTAMTAAGLDYLSDGRFTLGLGASGPQVIEGWHGVPYDAPLGRTREIIEICRMVWRRERLAYQGKHYQLPLPGGTGLGKPLKLINRPVRERIPIALAAIGPRNVSLAAELAEAWMPILYLPQRAADVWGEPVAEGRARRDPALGPLDVIASAPLAIGDDVAHLRERARPELALYVGGMGARGRNFYNNLARRLGYEAEAKAIQDAYLDGRKEQAEALVPAELLEGTSLIGPESYVRDRLAAYRESGVITLNVTPLAPTHGARVRLIERVRALAG
jgi:3-dehydroquinate dehydratase type II